MPTTDILIPWRAGCTHREQALEQVGGWYRSHGWNVVVGEHNNGPWSKAAAVTAALAESTSDIVAIADADTICEGFELAVGAVAAGAPWAIPHRMVHRLNESGDGLEEPAYLGYEGGGITVLPRTVYDQVPLDPRFLAWGSEDMSWAYALRTLAGEPWRGVADLTHLWHPPQDRIDRLVGSTGNRLLWRRYCHAYRKPVLMRALLDEIHPAQ
jgi:hypothetical protein